MGKFKFNETSIEGVYVIEPTIIGDERGYFMESYNRKDFVQAGLKMEFVQDNESRSKKGVLRGLHFQKKHSQGKLVRVTEGEVFDVAVDLRKFSPTYGKWEGVVLSAENKKQFYIPEGFAHGFLVLSETAVFNYKCTDYYTPEYEGGIYWADESINVKWPLEKDQVPILSDKDRKAQKLSEQQLNFF